MAVSTSFEQALEAFKRDDATQARRLAEQAAKEAPQDAKSRQLAGVAAMVLGDTDAAINLFTEVIRLARTNEEGALAWTGIGRCYLNREQFEKAQSAFQRALTLLPHLTTACAGLAYSLVALGYYEQGEAVARQAQSYGDKSIDTLNTLARALIALDRLDEAQQVLDTALVRDPNAAESRILQANLRKVRGDMSDAETTYREVLAQTADAPAWIQFAQIKTFREHDDEDLKTMEAQLAATQNAGPSVRSDLLFALAKAYDDLGNSQRAFTYLKEANEIQRTVIDYNADTDEARMKRIETLFNRDFIERFPDGGQTGINAIFVVSMPRSGSTLMEQMLGSHPQIRGGGEIEHFVKVATQLSMKWGAEPDFPNLDPTMAAADLREAGRHYGELTTSLRLVQPWFTDKSLANFQYIGLIQMMLPDARIVHMRRHPLATAFGLYRQRFARSIAYSYDFDHIARYYRAYSRLMDHWRRTCPEAFIDVFYESLVANPEYELRRVFDYLGVAFDPAVLEFYRSERPVRTASLVQVREPLSTAGVERHKRYGEHLKPLAKKLAEEIGSYEAQLEKSLSAATKDSP